MDNQSIKITFLDFRDSDFTFCYTLNYEILLVLHSPAGAAVCIISSSQYHSHEGCLSCNVVNTNRSDQSNTNSNKKHSPTIAG